MPPPRAIAPSAADATEMLRVVVHELWCAGSSKLRLRGGGAARGTGEMSGSSEIDFCAIATSCFCSGGIVIVRLPRIARETSSWYGL